MAPGGKTTFNFFNEIFVLGLLLYAVRRLELDAAAIRLVFVGGGNFFGAWFGPRLTHRFGYGRVLLATMAVGNAAPMAAVLTRAEPVISRTVRIATFGVMGVGIEIANTHAGLRQMAVAEDLRAGSTPDTDWRQSATRATV